LTKKKLETTDPEILQPEAPEQYTLTKEEFETAKAHIEGLQREKDELVDLLRRNQADFENYRKRNATAWADGNIEGRRECAAKLLPVLDDFERIPTSEDSAWGEGVIMVRRKLADALAAMGVKEIPTDAAFDPALHMAVQVQSVEGKEAGQIAAVLQKGYTLGERVLRHSMVVVTS